MLVGGRGGQRAHHYPYVNFTIHRFSLEVETTWFFLMLLEEPFLPQHMNTYSTEAGDIAVFGCAKNGMCGCPARGVHERVSPPPPIPEETGNHIHPIDFAARNLEDVLIMPTITATLTYLQNRLMIDYDPSSFAQQPNRKPTGETDSPITSG